MNETRDLVWERAVELLQRAPTWHELHRTLVSEGLDEHLGPAGMQRLLSEWHKSAAESLRDDDLAHELTFWAGGGSYSTHLKGFQAVPPEVLVDEAQRRRWFVRVMASRRAIVNPPEGKPITLQLGAAD